VLSALSGAGVLVTGASGCIGERPIRSGPLYQWLASRHRANS
jgi:hypothetical protein